MRDNYDRPNGKQKLQASKTRSSGWKVKMP